LQYTVTGTATGAGRNGHVESNGLKLNLATPKELGGTGKGENPEQLFAMGYSGMYIYTIPVLDFAMINYHT
jgi:organic hydroperoxide reductase OsmC/OhrA